MKNELKIIPSCDFWGNYDGYKVYKCFAKKVPNYPGIVFVKDDIMFLNGIAIGRVDDGGRVQSWDPNRALVKDKKQKVDFFVPEERAPEPQNGKVNSAEELLDKALKRSINELVGQPLADWNNEKSL